MRKKPALVDLNLDVRKGEVFGYLGPNGAGKTTTIKLLMNLITPSQGSIRLFDKDVKSVSVRRKIGFLSDRPYFYDYLTGQEFLRYCGKLYGLNKKQCVQKINELFELVGLQENKNIQLRKYSQGMLQRIGFAQVLLNDPDLLILDEPLITLDPLGRRQFKSIIRELKEKGKTIFFSSHILEDAEDICDRVGIIVNGRLKKVGVPGEFIKKEIDQFEITADIENESACLQIKSHSKYTGRRGKYHLFSVNSQDDISSVISFIHNAGGKLFSINPKKQTLEDIFIKETLAEN
ncbi:ABC transporter ATP-binding protein [candidate division KSB1 bacterium]